MWVFTHDAVTVVIFPSINHSQFSYFLGRFFKLVSILKKGTIGGPLVTGGSWHRMEFSGIRPNTDKGYHFRSLYYNSAVKECVFNLIIKLHELYRNFNLKSLPLWMLEVKSPSWLQSRLTNWMFSQTFCFIPKVYNLKKTKYKVITYTKLDPIPIEGRAEVTKSDFLG